MPRRPLSRPLSLSSRFSGMACLLLPLLGSCTSWPGLENPTTTIAPEYSLLRMSGKTRMQSGSPPVRGGRITVTDLGADDREDNVGVRVTYGDGFSGFELHYGRFESHSSEPGLATSDWGAIGAGAEVDTRVTMDEFRARYIAGYTLWEDEDEEFFWVKVGGGVLLAHREMSFDVRDTTSMAAQKIEIKDDVSPMVAVRIAGRRGPWEVTLDAAYNHDWSFGTGDIEGTFSDVSVRVSYNFEDQDLRVFGGYRRFDLPARGSRDGLEYDTDFTLDGYVLGFEFTF